MRCQCLTMIFAAFCFALLDSVGPVSKLDAQGQALCHRSNGTTLLCVLVFVTCFVWQLFSGLFIATNVLLWLLCGGHSGDQVPVKIEQKTKHSAGKLFYSFEIENSAAAVAKKEVRC